ncbi:hypothetical protein CBG25_09725 [Arsenophonus sp. ENCA]|uniref:gp53-like domain-containing protein n=1 Tax=Arsenophonus sp. ENCA TaxID=1987579 RepID=UPI000BD99375|nr:hypothetical protein [Arsenophonus sp. ENCA]PAV02635.1 hypothetical protein CBG25_09725 [Arsenophonus sp. ENCA]
MLETVDCAKNALDKRTGGTVNGPLTVEGAVNATAPDYLVKSGISHDKANNARNTQGLRLQGEGSQGSDIFFWEQIGKSAAMKFHVWSGGQDGVFEFHNTGVLLTNGGAQFGGNIHVSWGGRSAIFHENGDVTGPIWGGPLSAWIKNRTQASGGRGGWWYKDESSGFILQGGVVNRSGDNTRVNFPIGYRREYFGVQMTLSAWRRSSASNIFATGIENSGFNAVMYGQEVEANWWSVGV